MNWSEHFYYDETSPSCLRWAKNVMGGKNYKIIICAKDSVAGSKRVDSYWAVKVNGKSYKCHRIIYELHTNKSIENFVDHIDGNVSNNLISNLREVTHEINCRNRGKFANNSSGTTGVSFFTNKCGNTYWVAYWKVNNRRKSKCFSILRFGNDSAFKMACEYREHMINQIGGYLERSGK